MMSTDQAALIRAICTDPADDTARMVYADFCQENGDDDRAELIRDQVEQRAGSRDYDLLDANWKRWFPDMARLPEVGFVRHPPTQGIVATLMAGQTLVFERGLIGQVRFTNPNVYMSWAERGLWREQPVTRVVIHGREPDQIGTGIILGYRWYICGSGNERYADASVLPDELFYAFHDLGDKDSLIRRYRRWTFPTVQGAKDALSDGAVALGRHKVGLPMLPERVAEVV